MASEKKLEIVKDLILKGELSVFRDVFELIDKKYVSEKTGINYYRLLKLVANPRLLKIEDMQGIGTALGIPGRKVADLVFNQLESKKKK